MSSTQLDNIETTQHDIVVAAAEFNRLRELAYSASGYPEIQDTCLEAGRKLLGGYDPHTVGSVLITAEKMRN